jgi:hypothetical protein
LRCATEYSVVYNTTVFSVVQQIQILGKRENCLGYPGDPHPLFKFSLFRNDVFITSKLAPRYQGSKYAEKWILKSLQNLQTDYLDLLLIHWPGCFSVSSTDPQNKVLRRESWEAMEKLYSKFSEFFSIEQRNLGEKKLRAIGVSNYNTNHLDELLAHASVLPAVNQCEYHPLYYQEDLVNYCKEKEIHFQVQLLYLQGDPDEQWNKILYTHETKVVEDNERRRLTPKSETKVFSFFTPWGGGQEEKIEFSQIYPNPLILSTRRISGMGEHEFEIIS